MAENTGGTIGPGSDRDFKNKIRYGDKLEPGEVDALLRYAVERNIDPKGACIEALIDARDKWKEVADGEEDSDVIKEVLKHYAELTAKAGGVTGRTIIDSQYSAKTLKSLVYTTVIFVLLVALHGLMLQIQLESPSSGDPYGIFEKLYYLLNYISPFIWGVLGACVYLLKRLYDVATNLKFDATLYRGWWMRLVLGGVLGFMVTDIFTFTSEGEGANNAAGYIEFSKTAVAFLTGLGVRVVYGALERTIDVLAEKMGISTIKRTAVQDARAVITEHLANIDADQYPEKHQALLEVLQSMGQGSQTK